MRPVLEIGRSDGFDLWPIAEIEPFGFLALDGSRTSQEVGTALMSLALNNDTEDDRPAEPVAAFLHGLLTMDPLFAPGGMRVTDDATGVTLLPGCCNGIEDRQAWYDLLDARFPVYFGHSPTPGAELRGDLIRLTVDTEEDGSPVIELSVDELRALLAGAERDLIDFGALATEWITGNLPEHAEPLSAVLARALVLP
jgi:hypothetical protein